MLKNIESYIILGMYLLLATFAIISMSDPDWLQKISQPGRATEAKTYSVLDLVKPLDETEKQIVLLRAVDEMKFKDIAKVVDKPLGTVLWIYNKAIKSLKDYLEVEVEK